MGTYYNKEGLPTKKLRLAEKEVKKAAKIEKQQKLDEERFPNCNSRWAQDKGGEVQICAHHSVICSCIRVHKLTLLVETLNAGLVQRWKVSTHC